MEITEFDFTRLITSRYLSPQLIPFFFPYSLLPETATLQFHFARGHISMSSPPLLQPGMNLFLCFNLPLSICVFTFQLTLFIPSLCLPHSPVYLSLSVQAFLLLSVNLTGIPCAALVFKASSLFPLLYNPPLYCQNSI